MLTKCNDHHDGLQFEYPSVSLYATHPEYAQQFKDLGLEIPVELMEGEKYYFENLRPNLFTTNFDEIMAISFPIGASDPYNY